MPVSVYSDIEPVMLETSSAHVYDLFVSHPGLYALAVVNAARVPVGLVSRTAFFNSMAGPWGRPLFERRPIAILMDPNPLIVQDHEELDSIARKLFNSVTQTHADGYIVVDSGGLYLRTGNGVSLLAQLFELEERRAKALENYNETFAGLLLEAHDRDCSYEAFATLCAQRIAAATGVARVGIWKMLPDDQSLALMAHVGHQIDPHDKPVLDMRQAPTYLTALMTSPALVMHDVGHDHRAHELRDGYLNVHHVTSMLDVQIRCGDALVGVLCVEHVGTPRKWSNEDVSFVTVVAQLLAQKRASYELAEAHADLEHKVKERTQELYFALDAAEAASLAKSQFLATMSHELRTPLNAIIGYTELMREAAEDEGRSSEIVDHDRVLGAARRLLHLINGVLDMSKIESGRMDVEVGDVDIPGVARTALDAVRPQAEANGNSLRLELPDALPVARTDGFKLGQCLLNLLSNAAKFTKRGSITLRVRQLGQQLVFEVQDTGIGIPSEKLEMLFEPFVQADASTTRMFGGTGLGLAITRRMAQLLGGDVRADSQAGAGSTFTLSVPIHVHEWMMMTQTTRAGHVAVTSS